MSTWICPRCERPTLSSGTPPHRCANCALELDSEALAAWRPIETAPQDGTWFVICCAGDPPFFEVGRFDQSIIDTFVEVGDGLYRIAKKPLFDWYGFDNFHRATHWLPLPPVPNTGE